MEFLRHRWLKHKWQWGYQHVGDAGAMGHLPRKVTGTKRSWLVQERGVHVVQTTALQGRGYLRLLEPRWCHPQVPEAGHRTTELDFFSHAVWSCLTRSFHCYGPIPPLQNRNIYSVMLYIGNLDFYFTVACSEESILSLRNNFRLWLF